jgi:hypothetical protein
MQQNRKRDKDVPSRASNTEQANTEQSGASRERMTNRGSSDADLGTTSDRAMFSEGESRLKDKSRKRGSDHSTHSTEQSRGSGPSGERNRDSSGDGIGNREPDRERKQQDQLPEPGRSQSER